MFSYFNLRRPSDFGKTVGSEVESGKITPVLFNQGHQINNGFKGGTEHQSLLPSIGEYPGEQTPNLFSGSNQDIARGSPGIQSLGLGSTLNLGSALTGEPGYSLGNSETHGYNNASEGRTNGYKVFSPTRFTPILGLDSGWFLILFKGKVYFQATLFKREEMPDSFIFSSSKRTQSLEKRK